MKTLTIREMRESLTRLDELVAEDGEIVVTRRGRPLARVLPVRPSRGMPSTEQLRAQMSPLDIGSERLVRGDRDAR